MNKFVCKNCNKLFNTFHRPERDGRGKYCSKKCYWESEMGPDRVTRKDGYVFKRVIGHPRAGKSGYVYEHILVAEKIIGRSLLPKEEVHHINNNPSDNRPKNIYICKNRKEHKTIHAQLRIINMGGDPQKDRICGKCHKVLPKTDYSPNRYLGPEGRMFTCKKCRRVEKVSRAVKGCTIYL